MVFMWHPGAWVGVAGASLPRVISSHQHLVFGPEQANAMRRGISLQPPSRVRQGTPPFTSYRWFLSLESPSWAPPGKKSPGTPPGPLSPHLRSYRGAGP